MLRGSLPGRNTDLSLLHHFQAGAGTHATTCPVGTAGSSLGIEQLVHESGHSRPSNAKVKNTCFHSPIVVHDLLLKLSAAATFTSYITSGEKRHLCIKFK
jgi:hypothetical protein